MRRPAAGFFGLLVLAAGVCSGQSPQPGASPSHYIEVKLPRWVNSENVFVRYQLVGQEYTGWVQPHPGVSSYFISTTHEGRPVTRIKALLYAPGCAIQTLDIPVSDSNSLGFSFNCQPLPSVWIAGAIARMDRFHGREVKVQAKYVARWAQRFLESGNDIVTTIPVGDAAYPSPDGHFRLSVPDFSQDPLAGAPDHPGELQIWASDKTGDGIVALLIPAGPGVNKTKMGGLKIISEYPADLAFAPCVANPATMHDKVGFALRPGSNDLCDR